jgi:vacuolar-type H+-ATPase subunit H
VSFLSRFDRQATESGDLPALLGTATEEFRRSLERHVQQIVEAAKEQAATIERDADREARERQQQLDLRAREREQQLDIRSQELVKGVVTRASSVLDSIELVQSAISGMLAELRAEVKALESGEVQPSPGARAKPAINPGSDQRQAKEPSTGGRAEMTQTPVAAPATPKAATTQSAQTKESRPAEGSQPAAKPADPPPAQPAPAAEPQPPAAKPQPQQPAAEAEGKPKQGPLIERSLMEPKPQEDRNANSSAEFDQMIHGEIRRMFQSGKSRDDVESFLARFELGDSYHGLLDELYSQKDPSARRRIFGRRRDR